ncbi:cupin domain-containing protein [Afifella pfennigii]|uniref:cupin domain-containing protein n=1 Tax=Afifella pfennigii TaxID=209897 RepID=UPI00047AA6B0|nr:cupin domain-containing protein [Afifella pfennigii]
MPKVEVAALREVNATGYPPPYDRLVAGRFRKRLGDAGGLTQFGVNLCRLEPGAASAQRHFHAREDELVYVLEGEVALVEEDGETLLQAGDAATFKAGVADGHHLVNRSDRQTLFLEIGTRSGGDEVSYPDIDLHLTSEGGASRYTRKDGTPY